MVSRARSPSPVPQPRAIPVSATDEYGPSDESPPNVAPGHTECVTFEGENFSVPFDLNKLPDSAHLLMTIPDFPTLITWLCLLGTTFIALPTRLTLFGLVDWPCLDWLAETTGLPLEAYPAHYTILALAFWRVGYNLFLAAMLRLQSETQFLTKWVIAGDKEPTVPWRLAMWSLGHTLKQSKADLLNVAPQFRAWMLGQYVVNPILLCDGWAFVLVAIKYTNLSLCDLDTTMCVSASLSVTVGAFVAWGSITTKFAAKKVLSTHGWFYGDCWFILPRALTFDGVYAWGPHVMYTFGYFWTFAAAFMARSYLVLAVALVYQLSQLLVFMQLFEGPHIQRLYGSDSHIPEDTLSPTSSGRKPANAFLVVNFDPYRSGDWALAVAILLKVALVVLVTIAFPSSANAVVLGNTVFWYLVHGVATSYILWSEDNRDRAFSSKFDSPESAFLEFQRICNFLRTFATSSFVLATATLFKFPEYGITSPRYVAETLVGMTMIMLSMYNFRDAFRSFGTQGLYSADFFLDDAPTLSYTGLHRYLNHPSLWLGPLYMYGLALMAHNIVLLPAAVFAHALSMAHVWLVEDPHLRHKYGDDIRKDVPLQASAKRMRNTVITALKKRMKLMKTKKE